MQEEHEFARDLLDELVGIRVRRIRRTYDFLDLRMYELTTVLTVVNRGPKACHIVPSETFEKGCIVNFQCKDSGGGSATSIPSPIRNLLLTYLSLYRSLEYHMEKIAADDPKESTEYHEFCINVLPYLFGSSEGGLNTETTLHSLIEKLCTSSKCEYRRNRSHPHSDIMNVVKSFTMNGIMANKIRYLAGIGLSTEGDFEEMTLREFLKLKSEYEFEGEDQNVEDKCQSVIKRAYPDFDTTKSKERCQCLLDAKLPSLLADYIVRNLQLVNERFVPLLYLSAPIQSRDMRRLQVCSTHFIPKKSSNLHWWNMTVENEVDFPSYLPMFGTNYSFHSQILPPRELKLLYHEKHRVFVKQDRALRVLGKEKCSPISTRYFNIIHPGEEDEENCKELLTQSGFSQDMDSGRKRVSFTPRARLDENLLAIYAKRPTDEDVDISEPCPEEHILRITLGVERHITIAMSVWHALLWLGLILVLLSSLCLQIDFEQYGVLVIIGVSQTIATVLNDSIRSTPYRRLTRNLRLISLCLMALGIVLFAVVLSWPATENLWILFLDMLT